MRVFASALAVSCALGALRVGVALAAPGDAPLPEIRALDGATCLEPGAEIRVRGSHLGDPDRGWSFELRGVTLVPEAWASDEVRLRVPEDAVPMRASADATLALRSRAGGVLARKATALAPCEAQEVVPDAPVTRGAGRRSPRERIPLGSPRVPAGGEDTVAGELLLAAADPQMAAEVARAAERLGHREPARISELRSLGYVMVQLRFADRGAAEAASRALLREYPELQVFPSYLYRSQEAEATRRISTPATEAALGPPARACGVGLRIGVIDTEFDLSHPEFAGARITVESFNLDRPRISVLARHGTAVASLLVGRSVGAAPGAALYAAPAFWSYRGETVASTREILAALDWLISEDVAIVNLSLTGGPDPAVASALRVAAERGIALVAAGGEADSSGALAFPASLPYVVSVTAVDSRMRPHDRAPRGADFGAPGVDVRAADLDPVERFALRTGTSFAAPTVTAALALHPGGREGLIRAVRDLGEPGRDPVYGWGVVTSSPCAREPRGARPRDALLEQPGR